MYRGKIGNRKRIGQFGNHLFQFHFLHQLAQQLETGYFQSRWSELADFENSGRVLLNPPLKNFKVEKWSSDLVQEMTYREMGNQARIACEAGLDIELPSGILGEKFLESCRINPREIIKFKKTNSFPNYGKTLVALHFRGGDFSLWDKNAIMTPDYYLEAIDMIPTLATSTDLKIQLFTDEISHPTVLEIQRAYRDIEIISESRRNDFARMADSHILIASPSTFAFWAAVLGREKKLVMSKSWLDYTSEMGQKFWVDLRSNKNRFIKIDLEV
jgi:hypothetical protein